MNYTQTLSSNHQVKASSGRIGYQSYLHFGYFAIGRVKLFLKKTHSEGVEVLNDLISHYIVQFLLLG